jgi:Na+/melibiose symporter-like transporter
MKQPYGTPWMLFATIVFAIIAAAWTVSEVPPSAGEWITMLSTYFVLVHGTRIYYLYLRK